MNIIAENIARRRKELGLTQRELAEKLNISDKTLSRWETDKQVPDALMIPEIAKALDTSIGELYGLEENGQCETSNSHTKNGVKEEIDYARINAYKIVLLAGGFLIILGSGIYSFMGTLWNSMKVGAMLLLIIGLAVFLIGELTFEDFNHRKENSAAYKKAHEQWCGFAVPLIGLLIGVVIPAMKSPTVTMFNNWDAILPLLLFQGCVLILYRREHNKKPALHYIFAGAGIICIIGFLINALNNPYRYMGGFTYEEWEIDALWGRIKFFELACGFVFFCMNILHSKDILGIYRNGIRKMVKIVGIGVLAVSAITAVCIRINNKNLQSRVTYTSGEVPLYQLTNYSYDLIDWIEECNLSGEEICMKKSSVYRGEGEQADAYLIYLPHGYKDTELKIRYQVGKLGRNILKIEVENTTQIVDDTYYLCYVEILNHWENYDIQTYLNGERIDYMKMSTTSIWNVFE